MTFYKGGGWPAGRELEAEYFFQSADFLDESVCFLFREARLLQLFLQGQQDHFLAIVHAGVGAGWRSLLGGHDCITAA